MFRIESYITPIILSHIDKYVQDFRAKDAQVSLWGGEVAFQNLDLRLDVLEEELQLPFSFVSGHIHELTIRVPWTKIASEPIQITINTIEFVLKLGSSDHKRTPSSIARKKSRNDMTAGAPAPGYMASLVAKIANNISLKMHNVILKYVEDDIVVSMNIQLLSFASANELWQPDFVDCNPTKVLLRKLIAVSDLTVCLDKRNTLGIIDICQEPMLYRCSLQVRLLRRYNASSAHHTSLLRLDIFSDNVELNISAQQYPMLLRLLELANSLREGRLQAAMTAKEKERAAVTTTTTTAAADGGSVVIDMLDDSAPNDASQPSSTADTGEHLSMLNWAWNLLPTLTPFADAGTLNADDAAHEHAGRQLGHILHTGCYVNRLAVTFKSQELIGGDTISSAAKKLKYHPLVRIALLGACVSCVSVGRRWFSATGGIAHLDVRPLGQCVCGAAHEPAATPLLTSAAIVATHSAHLDGSLWDNSGGAAELPEVRSYDRIWEQHAERVRLADLQLRTPAFVFDVAHEVDVGDEHGCGSATSGSQLGSNLEYSNLSESYVCRAAIGELHVKYTASGRHIVERLCQYSQRTADYAPYGPPDPAPIQRDMLPPPTTVDYDALMSDIPRRVYEIRLQRPVIELSLVDDHPDTAGPALPVFVVELEDVAVRLTAPLYPNRLVYTTCLLPEPPAKLFDACYARYSLDFKWMDVAMRHIGAGGTQQQTVLRLGNTELTALDIIHPQLWMEATLASGGLRSAQLIVESATLSVNKPQLILLQCMADAKMSASFAAVIAETGVLHDSTDTALPIANVQVTRMLASYAEHPSAIGWTASVNGLLGVVYVPADLETVGFIESHKQKAIFVASEPDPAAGEFVSVVVQQPVATLRLQRPTLIAVNVGTVLLNVDPLLCQLLGYRVRRTGSEFDRRTAAQLLAMRSTARLAGLPRSDTSDTVDVLAAPSAAAAAGVAAAAEPDDATTIVKQSSLIQIYPLDRIIPIVVEDRKSAMPLDPFSYRAMFARAKLAAISFELRQCTMFVPAVSLRQTHRHSRLRDVVRSNVAAGVSVCTVRWPSVQLRSAHDAAVFSDLHCSHDGHRPPSMSQLVVAPAAIKSPNSVVSVKNGFPWQLVLSDWDGSTVLAGREQPFVCVNRTAVTVAVTLKTARLAEPSFVIHSDTGPIVLRLGEPQVRLLGEALDAVQALYAGCSVRLLDHMPQRATPIEISARPMAAAAAAAAHANDLKEFFGTVNEGSTTDDTQSTVPDTATAALTRTATDQPNRLAVWLQWTLAKLVVNLYATRPSSAADERLKFRWEMEDIITSYDQQEVYTKIRLKAGTMTGVCQTKTAGQSAWSKLDGLAVVARNTLIGGAHDGGQPGGNTGGGTTAAQAETFVEVTVTRALTQNVHGRWFSRLRRKQNRQLINTISEVAVTLQSIDVTVDMDLLAAFRPALVALSRLHAGAPTATVLSVRDYPIVYLKSEGVRVFFPIEDVQQPAAQCDVFFLKIGRIAITPTTENPLPRKPIRGDIYTKALELNILAVPGSSVENRQYELQFGGIALSSGRWAQIREHLEPSQSTVKNAHRVNPAFDWNNLTVRPAVEIRTIFERFNLSVVWAPCIVFENLLVCGECLEVNCVTDLVVELRAHEVRLLQRLAQRAESMMGGDSTAGTTANTRNPSATDVATPARGGGADDACSNADAAVADSGIESLEPTLNRRRSHVHPGRPQFRTSVTTYSVPSEARSYASHRTAAIALDGGQLPYDVAFVGGIFNVKVYHSHAVTDAAAATGGAVHPLVSFTAFQPNVLVSQSVIDHTSQLSLFNAIVRLGPALSDAPATASASEATTDDFPDVVFTTLPGQPNRAGIAQPLLRIKRHRLPTGQRTHFEVSIGRPNVVRVSHRTVQKVLELQRIFALGERAEKGGPKVLVLQQQQQQQQLLPQPSVNKFKALQRRLFGADRIQIELDATTVECTSHGDEGDDNDNAYSVTFGWSLVTSTVELHARQQRVRADTRVQAVALHAGTGIVLHPMTVRIIATLAREPWKRQPLCALSVRSTCVDVAVGANSVRNVQHMVQAFAASAPGPVVQETPVHRPHCADPHVELVPIATPRASRRNDAADDATAAAAGLEHGAEFYQDDLRAGAFQFIEPTTAATSTAIGADTMPLPYQIQISACDEAGGGTICWRYPQPRALHFVQIFPVLLPDGLSPSSSPGHRRSGAARRSTAVRCELEYYSQVHRAFQPFAEFRLSESSIQRPELPQRPIIAEVWRIRVHQAYVRVTRGQFEEDDGDGVGESSESASSDDADDNDDDTVSAAYLLTGRSTAPKRQMMNLHPRALVGCIRIDSKFHARLAPNFEVVVHADHLIVALRHDPTTTPTNATKSATMPTAVRQHFVIEANRGNRGLQTLMRLSQRGVRAYAGLYDGRRWAATGETRVSCAVLDVGYLTMQPLLEECAVRTEVHSAGLISGAAASGGPDVKLVADVICVRYGPCVGYTLQLAQRLWQREFGQPTGTDDDDNGVAIIAHRYLVCNGTSHPVKLGQVDTDEALFVRSNECLPYAFRSVRAEQRLRVSTETMGWSFGRSVQVSATAECHTQVLRMTAGTEATGAVGGAQLLIAQQQQTGGGQQIVITLRGQIEFRNMTGQDFQVQYRAEVPPSTTDADAERPVLSGAELVVRSMERISLVTQCDETIGQAIKLRLLSGDKKGWSGEIPLQRRPKSSPWLVKVPTHTEQQFCTFCVRVVRERLAAPPGAADFGALLTGMAAPPERLLIVVWPLFAVRSMLPVDVTVHDRATNQMYQLAGRGERPVELSIPGTDVTEHEISFDTNSYFRTSTKLCYNAIDDHPASSVLADQALTIDQIHRRLDRPPAVRWPCAGREEECRWLRHVSQLKPMQLEFRRLPSQPLSSCLMLDVLSACLFINSVACTVQMCCADGTATVVHANNVAMPATVTNQFTLAFMLDQRWYHTCPIYLASSPSGQKQRHRQQPCYEIADDGTAVVKLLAPPHALCKFQLHSSISNGVRVLIVAPHFVFVNHTTHHLAVWPFCALQRQEQPPLKLPTGVSAIGMFTATPHRSAASARGIGITSFANLSADPGDTNFNKLFNYYVAISGDEAAEFAVPVLLNRARGRHCFSLRLAETGHSCALSLSIVEHGGQTFVSVYPDATPCMRLINRTAHRLFVAQAQDAAAAAATADSLDDAAASVTRSRPQPLPQRTPDNDQFEWYTSCAAGGRSVYFTPPDWERGFPEQQTPEDFGIQLAVCRAAEAAPAAGWCRPLAVLQTAETFVDLPGVGDVRVSVHGGTDGRTVNVVVGHIDHNVEFNVKDIRTKLLHPMADVINAGTLQTNAETTIATEPVRTEDTIDCTSLPTPETEQPARNPLTLTAFGQGLHITLYSDDAQRHCRKTELMAVYLDRIAVGYTAAEPAVDVRLGCMQIDNQLHAAGSYDFPVMMCMQPAAAATAQTSANTAPSTLAVGGRSASLPATPEIRAQHAALFGIGAQPALTVNARLCAGEPDDLEIGMRPISAYIEDKYINVMMDYLLECLPANLSAATSPAPNRNKTTANSTDDDHEADTASTPPPTREHCDVGHVLVPHAVLRQCAELAHPLRMRRLRIQPLSVLLSVHTSQRMYIALDHSPLDFAAFEARHVYSLPARVGYRLAMHYVSGALFGAGWVVGSLEILGAPSGLARSVRTGLRDFVAMPVEGVVMRGPWGLLVGITHGSVSLVRNVTAGAVNSVTKLAASVARNLDWLTLDAEHRQRTEELRQRQRPGSIGEGIAQGLTGLGISLLGAVGGLSRHTLEAQSSMDVVAGLGRGLVGAVTKPISGAAELVALTGQGMLQTVGFNMMPAAREAPDERWTNGDGAEPAAAKITAKLVPGVDGGVMGCDQVLFVVVGTARSAQAEALAVALCTRVLVVVDVREDRVVEVFALERIGVQVDGGDETLVRIAVSGAVDRTAEEQEFQYSRVLQYVKDSSELVLPQSLTNDTELRVGNMDACENLRHNVNIPPTPASGVSSGGGQHAAGGSTTAAAAAPATEGTLTVSAILQRSTSAATAGSAAAQDRTVPSVAVYMDAHLARHLVQYVQLLQRIYLTKSAKTMGIGE